MEKIEQKELDEKTFRAMCEELVSERYEVVNFSEALKLEKDDKLILPDKVRVIMVRDIEQTATHALSLHMAQIETEYGLPSTFFPRITSFDTEELRSYLIEIEKLPGHEVGYQYEEPAFCEQDIPKARKMFNKNIQYVRQWVSGKVINAHGVQPFRTGELFKDNGVYNPILWMKYGIPEKGEIYYFLECIKDMYYYLELHQVQHEFITALQKTPEGDVALLLNHPWLWVKGLEFDYIERCVIKNG